MVWQIESVQFEAVVLWRKGHHEPAAGKVTTELWNAGEFLDNSSILKLLIIYFISAFFLNVKDFRFTVLMLCTMSLKVCCIYTYIYFWIYFFKEEILRNTLQEKIEIAAWKTFGGWSRWKQVNLMIRPLNLSERKINNHTWEQKQCGLRRVCKEDK